MTICYCDSLNTLLTHVRNPRNTYHHIYKTNNHLEWYVMLDLLREKIFKSDPYRFGLKVNQVDGGFKMSCYFREQLSESELSDSD